MEYSDNEYGSDCELEDDILGPDDLFNDEADEGGNDEQRSDNDADAKDNVHKEEDTKEKSEKKVKPRRVVKNTRVTLNADTLKGQNGLSALKKQFSDFKFKGNGHEKEDLTKMMGVLQQWMCYQLCPSYEFESCMSQLEALGKKKVIQTLLKKYRMGIDDWGERKSDSEDNVLINGNNMEMSEDINRNEFDLLLDEEVPGDDRSNNELSQTNTQSAHEEPEFILTQEQLERIARNKKLAEERKLQRMNMQMENSGTNTETNRTGDHEISLEKINLEENT